MTTAYRKLDRVRTSTGEYGVIVSVDAPPGGFTPGKYTVRTDSGKTLRWYSGSQLALVGKK